MDTGVCIFVDEDIDEDALSVLLDKKPAFIVVDSEKKIAETLCRFAFIGEQAEKREIPFYVFATLAKTGKTGELVKETFGFIKNVGAQGVFVRPASLDGKRLGSFVKSLHRLLPKKKIALCISSFAVLKDFETPVDEIYLMFGFKQTMDEIRAGWKALRSLDPETPAYPAFVSDKHTRSFPDIEEIAKVLLVDKVLLWSFEQFLVPEEKSVEVIDSLPGENASAQSVSREYEVLFSSLAIQDEAGFNALIHVMGHLQKGKKVTVVELQTVGKNVFGRLFGKDIRWVLISTPSSEYMKKTSGE